jgi:DNA-binding response OmpR family regulator
MRSHAETSRHDLPLALTLLLLQATMKVLIIEQEKTLQQSLSYYMERYKNCEVSLAQSKKEGIFLLQTVPFDVVLCGDRLPDGNGLEMLKELANQKPNLVTILMTVHGDDMLRQDVLNSGIRGYLEKPFSLSQLEEAIGVNHL